MRSRKLLFLFISILFFSCSFQQEKASYKTVPASETVSILSYFSPKGGCTSAIIREIENANSSIDAAIFSFTSKKLARALISAHNKGIKVRVIIDQGTAKSKRCVASILKKAGIPVRFKRGSGGGLMHNKFAVIDGKVVITGSFNWTVSAEKRNDENIVIIKGDRETSARFKEKFEHLWRLAYLEE
ncbi:phospholipase D family protein [Desulfurobacterium atlanticum]|uniref:phospholipase D n=1 Tax=Desulfurobacterium atlanticum TaxID=240169 RepID=A0A238Z1Z1_9BACT|nr:phospholipase D family protein [Desulfurobacterium atlanticum]SNR77475.1 PLD-like domain-containing protein [Desulfurobacterium atlanticum]